MTKRTLSREAKRLEPFLNLPRKAVTGGRSDALVAHSGLDYIVAHDTSDPTVNRNGTYYSYNFGVIGGAGVDESNNILAMLNTIGVAGGGRVVIRAADPADPIHMAKTVSIYYSNMQVVFAHGQVVTYEDKASLRIMGDYAQITRKVDGTAMKLHVASTVVSNETVLELSATDTALMDAEATPSLRIVRVGDKIVVRGQNDASGKAIEKDTSFVKALAKVGSYWQITCTDELDYTFEATYPASEWPADLTTGTTIYIIDGSLITASTAVNDTVVAVTDGTVFAVGDMVEVGDNRNEYAMNASAITGAGNPYKNPANLEQAQIIAISGNNITLDHALCRSASTTYYAFMALMVPVVNSTISGARISYTADGIRSANALQITYAMDCHIYDCYVNGLSGSVGRKGHGLRISYSYKCSAYRNHIVNAAYTGSGEGYGITIYYATLIMVDHNYISGCRHNILLQLATLAKVIANVSIDDRISGIDLHGVYSVRCSIQNNDVSRSSLNTSDSTKPGGIRIGNTSHTGGDHYNVIEGNTITGYSSTTADGIDIFAASTGNVIRNNTVIDCTVGLRFGLNSSQITPVQFIDNTLVEGNIFTRCTSRCVEIIAQPTYDNATSNGKFSQITMINNISDGNDRHFEITGVVTTLGISDVIMVGNQVINPVNTTTTYYGISVKYTSGFVHVYDNNVSKAQRGIYLQGNGVCHVIGNKTANTVQTDPFTDGGGNTSVNYIDAMVAGGTTAPTLTGAAISDTAPRLVLIETDGAANNKRWHVMADGEQFKIQASADGGGTSTSAITIDRTLNVIDSVAIGANAISLIGATTATGTLATTGNAGIGTSTLTDRFNVVASGTGGATITAATAGKSLFSNGHQLLLLSSNYTGGLGFLHGANGIGIIQAYQAATEDGILSLNRNGGNVGINTDNVPYNLFIRGDVAKGTTTTETVFGFGSANTPGTDDLLIYGRVGNHATAGSRWGGFGAYENGVGGRLLWLQDLGGNTKIGNTSSDNTEITGDLTVTGNVTVSGNFGGWTLFTYNTDWSDYNSSNSPGRYRKVGDIVYVEGFVKRASSGTSALITTMAYGPVKDKHFVTDTNSATLSGRIEITSAGTITLIEPTFGSPATIGYVCLDGIVFSTT